MSLLKAKHASGAHTKFQFWSLCWVYLKWFTECQSITFFLYVILTIVQFHQWHDMRINKKMTQIYVKHHQVTCRVHACEISISSIYCNIPYTKWDTACIMSCLKYFLVYYWRTLFNESFSGENWCKQTNITSLWRTNKILHTKLVCVSTICKCKSKHYKSKHPTVIGQQCGNKFYCNHS